jgi:glycosyltransferase involved in cell wall biosynthesis
MRIGLVSTFPPQVCGIAAYTKYLVDGLVTVDPSLSVTVLAEHGAGPTQNASVIPCFRAEDDYVDGVLNALRHLDLDVVHVQHEYGIFGVDARFPRLLSGIRALGVPVVLTLHTVHTALSFDLGCTWRHSRPPLDRAAIERYQRDLGDGADVVVAHQRQAMGEVLVRQGVAEERVVTIPHGTLLTGSGIERFDGSDGGRDPESPLLVAFGYFEPAKNVHTLLEAFSLLRSTVPGARLLVGGYVRYPVPETVAYRARCARLVTDFGLEGAVTILDRPVAEDDVEAMFASAEVACFVYDEDSRSASGALHRAIGSGVPSIASRIPKFSEVGEISDELLVNPRSSRAIARLLNRVLGDADFAAHVRRRSAQFAEATSWERVAMRHAVLYRDVAEGRVGAASRRAVDALVP